MKKRLRKKLRRGEFAENGFHLIIRSMLAEKDTEGLDILIDDVITIIEKYKHECCGVWSFHDSELVVAPDSFRDNMDPHIMFNFIHDIDNVPDVLYVGWSGFFDINHDVDTPVEYRFFTK